MGEAVLILRGRRKFPRASRYVWAALFLGVVGVVVCNGNNALQPLGVVLVFGFVGNVMVSAYGLPGQIKIGSSGELRMSWRSRPIDRTGISFGRWMRKVSHLPTGVVVFVGPVAIGGTDRDDSDIPRDARRVGKVDFELSGGDLGRLIRRLGVRPQAGPGDEIVIELLPQHIGSPRAAAPYLGIWAAVMAFIGVVAVSPLRYTMSAEAGLIAVLVIVAIGCMWTFRTRNRPARTTLSLLANGIGFEGRVTPWKQVKAVPRTHRYRGYITRVLELDLGSGKPLKVGGYADRGWARPTKEVFWPPRYVVGPSQWPTLVSTLERKKCL